MSAIRDVIEKGLYKDALSFLMWVLSFKTEEQKREYLKTMHRDFLTSEYSPPPAQDGDVLFMRSLGREDYALMFGVIYGACDAPKTYFASFLKTNVPYNAKAAAYFEEHLDLLDRIEISNPIDRQCAYLLLLSFGYQLEAYAGVKIRALVTFSDMQPIENLFAKYFRAKGVATVSMQHGLYIDYGEYKTINCINYLNHASEYHLAWGDNTAALLSAYHPEARIALCGKPMVFQGAPTEGKPKSGRSILLALDQRIFDTQNYAMTSIAREYAKKHGYKVTVRFHPSNDRDLFFKTFPDVVESINFLDADIVIGHTTSLLFEAMAMGKRVVQYKTPIPTVNLPRPFQFANLAGLEKAVAAPREEDQPAKAYFCALGNASKDRYAEFFRFLLKGDKTAKVEFYKGPKVEKKPHSWYEIMQRHFYEDPDKAPALTALPAPFPTTPPPGRTGSRRSWCRACPRTCRCSNSSSACGAARNSRRPPASASSSCCWCSTGSIRTRATR